VRIKSTAAAAVRWLLMTLRRGTPEPTPALQAPRTAGACFGPMSARDELALKGFLAGDERAAHVLRWGVGDDDLDS
jgi:hypothetical protein